MAAPSALPAIDVDAVERELIRLRRLPENSSPSGDPAARTAVLSLVAYAPSRAVLDRVVATVEALVNQHPSRTIVVYVNEALPAQRLDARVDAQCRRLGTGLPVCNEMVVIEAHPSAVRRVPNVILPLLLPDLPAIFWWPGEPPRHDPLVYDLLEPVNRLVVDSAEFAHVERALTTLAGLRGQNGRTLDLADLNWGRLRPWRELVAQFWDMPAWRQQLRGVDRVEVELTRPPGGRSNRQQALLLVGWLASRLGWRPVSLQRLREGYDLRAQHGKHEVGIGIRIKPGEASGVQAVRLVVSHGRQDATYEVKATEDDCAVTSVQRAGAQSFSRMHRLESFDLAELLALELDTASADVVFEGALESAVAFLKLSGAS